MSLDIISTTALPGIGPKMALKLAKLGIHSIADLLYHFPLRYQDRTRITPIRDCIAGEYAVIEGQIADHYFKPSPKALLTVTVSDGFGRIVLRFFNAYKNQAQLFAKDRTIRVFGLVTKDAYGMTISHPEYQWIDENNPLHIEELLTPIYPSTQGVGQKQWRKFMGRALSFLDKNNFEDLLQDFTIPDALNFSFKEAIQLIHKPTPDIPTLLLEEGMHPAQQRLSLEELCASQCALLKARQAINQLKAAPIEFNPTLHQAFLSGLSFVLTIAQQRVINEILDDLSKQYPMQRLVQGDVGSGKTVVAASIAIQIMNTKKQVALMAPTELLAEQHAINFKKWLQPLGFNIALLTGSLTQKQRRPILEGLNNGDIHCVIGTHALFQKTVHFNHLGLVVIDEQHRFGVAQRLELLNKYQQHQTVPHQLVMTATPIPRTLAMSAYADLDISQIDELPPGRTPIHTVAIPDSRRDEIITRIQKAIDNKRQVYWVCALIEESESLQCQAAQDTFQELSETLTHYTIGLLHGRMPPHDKETIMQQFKRGEIDCLVATTVIEVGVDVPNATLMIIENAERFGLAQLHQLRGRVGRGSLQSYCVLLYHSPLSKIGKQRLAIMRDTTDGFVIAEEDLKLRGPGEVLGTRQTGLAQFRVADLLRDKALLPLAKQLAIQFADYPEKNQQLIARWLGDKVRLVQV